MLDNNYPSFEEMNSIVLLFPEGRYREAATLAQAITVRFPLYAFGWVLLGDACNQMGQHDKAVASYQHVLNLKPDFAEIHNNLGIIFRDTGRLQEAEPCFQQALKIKPDYVEAHINLGVVLKNTGRLSEAEASYRLALLFKPDSAEAYTNLGNLLKESGRLDEAESCYRKALHIKPDWAEGYFNLGVAMQASGRLTEAEISYLQALQLKPDFAEAHSNLGNTLKESGRLKDAEVCYRKALEINPNAAELHSNLGVVLKDLCRLTEAELSCRQALFIHPDFAGAHNNLGVILKESGRLLEAEQSYRRAIEIQPDYAEAHSNLAIALLTRGAWAEGWIENEWRWQTPQMINGRRNFAQPQWRGEKAEGLTLLIHAEQGYGDTLQFCRYASLAAARGLKVVLEVQPPLVRLLGSLHGIERVLQQGEKLPAFDLHCPMLSLPLALNTTLTTIPCAISYLQADKAQSDFWSMRLAALSDKRFRVGLVWAGNSHSHWPQAAVIDRQRSLPPELFAPLLDCAGFHFFSLQKGGARAPEHFRLTDFMNEIDDFADTAALIDSLDLIISVDTAVSHLAAALGKPVWVLNRFDSCWRWLRERDDSPWYASVRLFRQPAPGDWQSVIEKVVVELGVLRDSF